MELPKYFVNARWIIFARIRRLFCYKKFNVYERYILGLQGYKERAGRLPPLKLLLLTFCTAPYLVWISENGINVKYFANDALTFIIFKNCLWCICIGKLDIIGYKERGGRDR